MVWIDEKNQLRKFKLISYLDIQKGDIALFKGTSWISKMIMLVTQGVVSHTALIINKDEIIHAINKGIIKQKLSDYLASDERIRCYIKRIKSKEFKITEELKQKVIDYANSKIGAKYDWINIWALLWRSIFRGIGLWRIAKIKYLLDNRRLSFICSELIVESYQQIKIDLTTKKNPDPALITPQDLYKNNKLDFICNL